ncbi:hypothetical protein [Burkholderia cepacia]|nr:hypothetical protein [Burkholderia cepacia]MBB0117645.1 hypothetical protein [Burkholderia cepacia]MBX4067660.1 hypothetical protein [Burkholderia cepacia]
MSDTTLEQVLSVLTTISEQQAANFGLLNDISRKLDELMQPQEGENSLIDEIALLLQPLSSDLQAIKSKLPASAPSSGQPTA